MRQTAGVVVVVLGLGLVGFGAEVGETQAYVHPTTGLTVVGGTVSLPAQGMWYLDEGSPVAGGLLHVQVQPPPEAVAASQSVRIREVERNRLPARGRWPLHQFYRLALEHARTHQGIPPYKVEELDEAEDWVIHPLAAGAYGDEAPRKPAPYYAILPDAVFEFAEPVESTSRATNHVPYVVELHPIFADGKHWVLYTDGKTFRVDIDPAMVARYGLAIDPLLPDPAAPPIPEPEMRQYRVYAIQAGQEPAALTVRNVLSGERIPCSWNASPTQAGTAELAQNWATMRVRDWARYLQGDADAPILRQWSDILVRQYGAKPVPEDRQRRRSGETTDAFGVLGGRAAMRETLQMRLLEPAREAVGPGVPMASIPGVQVKSHPYAAMLDGQAGGSLPLADWVPLDRFFVYVRQPQALLPLLGQGSEFMARLGAGATGRSLVYGLEDRYLARLGLNRQWLEHFLKSGLVTEMGLVLPDLFLVDGTELTVLSRVPQIALLQPLLKLAGVPDLAGGQVVAVNLSESEVCYWAIAGDLVMTSTDRGEIDRVLGARDGRTPGLGKSDEFRFMLTRLAPTEQTRCYAYFSDPFIRRLVGPEMKIGQLRRVKERARMEALTAAALLFGADGHGGRPTTEALVETGYLNPALDWNGLSLDDQGRVVSRDFGRLDRLASVSSHPILLATEAEAEAYGSYVENYSRFWRRYFDPIAVRLDDTADGGLAIETFILPLLDSSMYDGVRSVLGTAKSAPLLHVPRLEPTPVALVSLNLSEHVWRDMLGDMFRRGAGDTASAALDQLGPAVHVMVHDSDPVIAFGSGDLLGLGGQVGGRGREVFGVPLLVSLLTRPVTIAVELADPEPVRQFLEMGALRRLIPWQREPGGQAEWYQIGDKDAWVLGMGFMGVGIRFRFQIQDSYLFISNLPWIERVQVTGIEPAATQAVEVRLRPDLVQTQLAAMFTAAQERQRAAALGGMGYLEPFAELGMGMDEALAEHRRLLGFSPWHPAPGKWLVENGQLVSSMYGQHERSRQPEFRTNDGGFGLLQGVSDLRLGLQFEDEGLRTRVRWTFTN